MCTTIIKSSGGVNTFGNSRDHVAGTTKSVAPGHPNAQRGIVRDDRWRGQCWPACAAQQATKKKDGVPLNHFAAAVGNSSACSHRHTIEHLRRGGSRRPPRTDQRVQVQRLRTRKEHRRRRFRDRSLVGSARRESPAQACRGFVLSREGVVTAPSGNTRRRARIRRRRRGHRNRTLLGRCSRRHRRGHRNRTFHR
jgi:hypothetical protein